MADDPTEDFVRSEIAAAVKILREDGVHIHRSYEAFQKSKQEKDGKTDEVKTEEVKTEVKTEETSTEGTPPPVKEDGPTEKPKRKGLWWGDRDN